MVQFCSKAVTSLKAMTEGGRRVLLVAAKTTPLMIRDAMTGEWQGRRGVRVGAGVRVGV